MKSFQRILTMIVFFGSILIIALFSSSFLLDLTAPSPSRIVEQRPSAAIPVVEIGYVAPLDEIDNGLEEYWRPNEDDLASFGWTASPSHDRAEILALMHVAMNRSMRMEKSIRDVAYSLLPPTAVLAHELDVPQDVKALAAEIVRDRNVDPTNGAWLYHTINCVSRTCADMREHGIGGFRFGSVIVYQGMRDRRELTSRGLS